MPPARQRLLLTALAVLSLYVAAVWAFVLLRPESGGAFVALGLPLTSAFIFAHLLGLAAGGLLWRGGSLDGATRLLVRVAAVYFAAMTLYALGGAFLMTLLLGQLMG